MNSISTFLVFLALSLGSCKSAEHSQTDVTSESEHLSGGGTSQQDQADTAGTAREEGDQANETTQRMTGRELIGTWEWVRTSCCGRTARDIFPEPGEEPKIISFNKEGRALYYSGDEAKTLADQPFSIGELGSQATVRIGEFPPALFWVDGDELSLSWGYMDLQIEYYRRVK